MDIDECIDVFTQITGSIFKKKRNQLLLPLSLTGKLHSRYDAIRLEDSIKQVLNSLFLDQEAPLIEDNDVKCKM